MKKIISLTLASILCYVSFSQNVTGVDEIGRDNLNTITTAVPFLLISPDSRAGGMGDVGVATSPDANSLHWNPAKFAFVEDEVGFAVSYVPWLRALVPDINLSYLAGYKKLNKNEAIAMELRYFTLGDITFTDVIGNNLGQYKPSEFSIGSAYSRKLSDQFSLAISGRYIYSNLTGGQSAGGITTNAGQSIAADVAGYFRKDIRIAKKDMELAIGANISNIGNKVRYTETSTRDFIPINLRLGTALNADLDEYNKISFAFDINKLLVPTPPIYNDSIDGQIDFGQDPNVSVVSGIFQSFGDAPGGFSEEMREINYSIGTEYWYDDQFAVRAGYFNEHNTKGGRKFFTFGSGVKYNVFALDFSYLINASRAINGNNPLANTMRFTLIFDFGAMENIN
ncbi:MAG: type IX secretion system outer membrane channel protein PorV [Pelagibacterales bacterium]|nr:type IX secretion system outer membrane channel protein PorV [Pelagibacterales bacterium]MBL6874475.1 type IX secretion system outer membrane channel protein PorV [Flavobacteriales bacterium]